MSESAQLVERTSGLVVPGYLADAETPPVSATVDGDGRRRVVLTKDEHKKVLGAIKVLEDRGFAVVLRCQNAAIHVFRFGKPIEIKPAAGACGNVLKPEDNGCGCQCSRIHLTDL